MNGTAKKTTDITPFVQLTEVQLQQLIPILESRLPRNSHVYNAVIISPKFKKEMKIFMLNPLTYGPEINEHIWIFVVYERVDVRQDISASAPDNPKITPELKQALLNTKIFDWDVSYFFSAIERSISPLIYDISIAKGNATHVYPCFFYYCPKQDALALDTRHDDDVNLTQVELVYGPDFITNGWNHASEGSQEYVKQSIERNITSGVYTKDGKPISGMLMVGHGVMGLLYTNKTYRNKNYGKLCMQNLMKELTKNGFIPCSAVEICNETSIKFHKKVGMKCCSTVDYIRFNGPTVFK